MILIGRCFSLLLGGVMRFKGDKSIFDLGIFFVDLAGNDQKSRQKINEHIQILNKLPNLEATAVSLKEDVSVDTSASVNKETVPQTSSLNTKKTPNEQENKLLANVRNATHCLRMLLVSIQNDQSLRINHIAVILSLSKKLYSLNEAVHTLNKESYVHVTTELTEITKNCNKILKRLEQPKQASVFAHVAGFFSSTTKKDIKDTGVGEMAPSPPVDTESSRSSAARETPEGVSSTSEDTNATPDPFASKLGEKKKTKRDAGRFSPVPSSTTDEEPTDTEGNTPPRAARN